MLYLVNIMADDDQLMPWLMMTRLLASLEHHHFSMLTTSNGNILRVTGPLWGEFTGHQWIPLTKVSDAELWCFL